MLVQYTLNYIRILIMQLYISIVTYFFIIFLLFTKFLQVVCLIPKMAAKVTQYCSKFFPRFRSSVFTAQLCLSTYLAWTWMFTATYETKAWCLIIKRPATTCFVWQSSNNGQTGSCKVRINLHKVLNVE